MVIVLTKEEKRTFYSFLGLYLGSSLLLIGIISWLFYSFQSNQLKELTLSKMEISASTISNKIIHAHMQGLNLDLENLKISNDFQYSLYDSLKKHIYKQFNESINFKDRTFKKDGSLFYINQGSAGHLSVFYIVIKENSLEKILSQTKQNIIYITILIYIIISLVGFFLAKLFIYPIQSQREKLNTFIKDTTHELNTPLSALLLCVNSDYFYNEENRERIKISAIKISNLYKDLTYITLREHQKSESKEQDISEILKAELSYYNKLAQKKSITISHAIEKAIFNIDKEDFIRLISNLISNAIKYTKRNGEISITMKENILVIQDTGIGIDKEKLNKIYKRYYRATDSVGGFGIGLSIVYSICQKYNIKIDVKSQIKKGTTFKLSFN